MARRTGEFLERKGSRVACAMSTRLFAFGGGKDMPLAARHLGSGGTNLPPKPPLSVRHGRHRLCRATAEGRVLQLLQDTEASVNGNGASPPQQRHELPQHQRPQQPSSPAPASPPNSQLLDPQLVNLLKQVAEGQVDATHAAMQLREFSSGYKAVSDFAQLDSWRVARTGAPEVVWGPGKSPEQIAAIMTSMAETEAVVLATRIPQEMYLQVREFIPNVQYNSRAQVLSLKTPGKRKQERLPGTVAVLSAGTADEGVAEECRAVADYMGCYSFRMPDVSVDGLHRILHNLAAVRAADVIVVVAGTDGALPSVVAGLVEAPVIAVPTSAGYGAALQGLTPLLSALVSSSPGMAVVNIDNGFGAAMLAARMLKSAAKLRRAAM